MSGLPPPGPRAAPALACPECGQPGHADWDCANTFAVLRALDRAERTRAALREVCRHGERLAGCLAIGCRETAHAMRTPGAVAGPHRGVAIPLDTPRSRRDPFTRAG